MGRVAPLDGRVPRRSALAGAAGAAAVAGISTLVLPRAAAAASSALEPTLADGSVAGAFQRSGDVAGTANTYLVLTHSGTVGEDSVYDLVVSSQLDGVDGVIVAGGGAGGAGRGAGGGAGGLVPFSIGALAVGTYRVTVGGGGVGVRVDESNSTWSRGGSGRPSDLVAISGSSLPDLTAVGGGGGGADSSGQRTGADGGSGGGGGGYGTSADYRGGSGTSPQGAAGASANSTRAGGGGGRGQAAGVQNVRRSRQTGNTTARNSDGGDGAELTVWCAAARSLGGPEVGELDDTTSTYHLAGGGGGFDTTTGNVSSCGLPGLGGGRGGYATLKELATETIQDGLPHTGGGGGGLQRFYTGGADGIDGGASGGRGGHGGSGVVILRWRTAGNTFPTVTRVS